MIENHSHYPRRLQGLFFWLLSLGTSLSAQAAWLERVPLIEKKLQEAVTFYQNGDIPSAKEGCDDAYFEIFENVKANMEVAIRSSISLKKAASIEESFGKLRKSFSQKKELVEVKANLLEVVEEIKSAAQELDKQKVSIK